MAAKPATDAQCIEALEAEANYANNSEASRGTGIPRRTIIRRAEEGRNRGLHLSKGAQNAMRQAGLSGIEAKGGWIHNYDDDGKKTGATRWTAPEIKAEDIVEKFQLAFENIKPAKPIKTPKQVVEDKLTLYPLYDLHLGMRAWSRETLSNNYDLDIAAGDVDHAFAEVKSITPNSQEAIFLIGGDALHANDEEAQTPQSKHNLDVDGRFYKVLEIGIQLLASVIEGLLKKHKKVTVRVLRGNHDESAHMVLTFALFERYRNEPRIVIERNPADLFMHQWGNCLIAAHHGDRAPPERLAMYIADVCRFWSECRHRFVFTGHLHSDASKDIGGCRWERLRAFCPQDSYAAGHKFASRRALQAITFDKTKGIVLRAIDPIERAKDA